MTTPATAHPTVQEADVVRALTRGGIYRLLGRVFGYPTPGVLAELAPLAEQATEAPELTPDLRQHLAGLAVAARDADPGVLAGEHVFLFDRQVRCPPYESAYAEAPRMAGKSAELADVAGFYAAFGLTPALARPDMEDHIAVELEFMSALALKEAYALAEGDTDGIAVTRAAQLAFLTDHLGRWAEPFAESLRAATPVPYYATAAGLLAAWVLAEFAALGATPTRLEGRADPGPAGEDAFTCPMAEPHEPRDPTGSER
jgi:TorA maturation chaperone TorD